MSNTQYAFLKSADVPSRAALQASIDALGFDLKLDPDLNLLADSGFSPCTLAGVEDVGFELIAGSADEVFEGAAELAPERDYCIGMIWRGSMKDCASVMIVSAALAKNFGAIISYEGDAPEPTDKLLEGAREVLVEALDAP
jgi:hypothetical protein